MQSGPEQVTHLPDPSASAVALGSVCASLRTSPFLTSAHTYPKTRDRQPINMPDLNSLPPSRSTSINTANPRTMSNVSTSSQDALRGQSPSPLSRSASTSLQAAAAVNAGLQHEDTQRSKSATTKSPIHRFASASVVRLIRFWSFSQ